MVLSGTGRRLLILLASLLVTVASHAPARADTLSRFGVGRVSLIPDVDVPGVCHPTLIVEGTSLHIADIADKIFEPPAFSSVTSTSVGVKSLPAVAGTLLMVVTGFVSVLLVKDRRVRLSVTAALLWLGRGGISNLRQLAWHLLGKRKGLQPTYQNITCRCGLKVVSAVCAKSGYKERCLSSPAIISVRHRLDVASERPVSRTGRRNCSSPALTFDELPRGPPVAA